MNMAVSEDDNRTLSDLLIDQVEFAFRFVNADGAACVVNQPEHGRAGRIGCRNHIEPQWL